MVVHHVGYLVKKLDRAVSAFVRLGYQILTEVIDDDYRQISICFLKKDGYCIELVSPKSKTSIVAGLMKQFGNSPYHICYQTNDLERQIEILAGGGMSSLTNLMKLLHFQIEKYAF